MLLIAPYGIETSNPIFRPIAYLLLIAPYGIETMFSLFVFLSDKNF